MARDSRRILPFRIPFFRIFYSTTYTTLYIICLCLLAITPASLIYTAIENSAYQYIFVIGGVYVLTALLAIFIYSSRLYTNRTVLAGVGKAYIPVEDGEVGKKVRKMIVKQLERSAIVAWESRPRDTFGEILRAEKQGILPADSMSVDHNDYTVGRVIQVDPAYPPWGRVQHAGWSSPSHRDDNKYPDVQFATVLQELPNLIEAQAVSLAPTDPTMTPVNGQSVADPAVVELLQRPETMGMRDYLTQLSYLGLVNPPELGQRFLQQYEHARYCGGPVTEAEFGELMATFSELLCGMTELDGAIIQEIRAQTADAADLDEVEGHANAETQTLTPSQGDSTIHYKTPSPASTHSPGSSVFSPVTAREGLSRNVTPYLQPETPSMESFSSVIHNVPHQVKLPDHVAESSSLESASMVSLPSDAGSVLRHGPGGSNV